MIRKIIVLGYFAIVAILAFGCNNTKIHSVTFVIGDGQENRIEYIDDGEIINVISDPIKDNYLFLGWYEDMDYNNEFNFSQPIYDDINIYARFSLFELGKENYIAFKDNDLYGFMLPDGTIIVEPIYDSVQPFRYGFALVKKDDQFTFIDSLGNEFDEWFDYQPFAYSGYIQFTVEGLAKIYEEERVTKFIDTKGIIQYETDLFIPFEAYYGDGLIPAYTYDEQNNRTDICVYLNDSGEIVLNNYYHNCSSFNDGLAAVEIDSRTVFINTSGDIVLDNNFNYAIEMFDGIKPVYHKDGYAIVKTYTILGDPAVTSNYLVINDQGTVIFESESEIPIDITEGYILTKNSSDQVAIYDTSGNIILDYDYYAGGYTSLGIFESKVIVYNASKTACAVVDVTSGELIIGFEYESITPFKDGYAIVRKDGLYGVINENNEIVVDITYDELFSVFRKQ